MYAYYTYFDQYYAVRAVAMYQSLRRNSGPMQMFMFCLDDEAHRALARLQLPDVTLVRLAELEQKDPELLQVKPGRSTVEYYFTCTSCAGCFLMNTQPAIQVLTYLDADLFFYRPVEPLLKEFQGYSIGVTYQRFPRYGQPRTGRYNVGWLSWRRDPQGLGCLREYRRQCLEWCYLREENGKFADQAYLDAWEQLPGFHAFQARGANVAPWNLGSYTVVCEEDDIRVDGEPLIFFHFHKFSALSRNWFDSNLWRSKRLTKPLRERLILPYIDELRSTTLNLPLSVSRLRHFPYKQGLPRLARNVVRVSLAVARSTYVYYPERKGICGSETWTCNRMRRSPNDSGKRMPDRKMLVHATNVTGLGATQVVQSLLDGLAQTADLSQTVAYASDQDTLDYGAIRRAGMRVEPYRRLMPKPVSRAWECLVVHQAFQDFQRTLILGDVPLRGANGQVVFIHQPHLISPRVNGFCSSSSKSRLMRWVFRQNLPYVKAVVVQTEVMRDQMIASYPELQQRLMVISHPMPNWLQARVRRPKVTKTAGLRLFYPVAGYPHKNHALLKRMDGTREVASGVELVVTLSQTEQNVLAPLPFWVRNMGLLSREACLGAYQETDALFFPSLLESYGLPLVEAMTLGLPIACADQPYARWLCEDQAIYFDPLNADSAWLAIRELRRRLAGGWQPDWRRALAKLPKDWNEVARRFLQILELPTHASVKAGRQR